MKSKTNEHVQNIILKTNFTFVVFNCVKLYVIEFLTNKSQFENETKSLATFAD